LVATLELAQQTRELFPQFLLLQDNRHNNSLKRPWASDHDPGLNMQLGAVEESVEERLIGIGERLFERHPAAAFLFDEGAERRERLTQGMILRR
jgi:hypothetical protein